MILRILCCAILQFCIIGYAFGVVPQITRLNVQCDRTGMKVNVEFDNPFNGIIFSKGHYSDPNCRWVASSSSRRQFNFYIGTAKCGTIGTDMAKDSTSPQGFKNVIIIQNDPDYQEVWDSARKLSCDWVTRLEKYVTFAPFGVDMLGVKELRFPGDTVDCWMDIQRGHGPFAPSVGGVVPIGEKLTVVIYVRDTDSSFDVHVKDCYAYDSSDYRNPDARAIKLTDERGCPLKEKLVQGFYRTRDVRTSGATIIAYGIVNAFKFPERMDVFLACNVEVCKGTCPNNDCQPEVAVAGSGEEPTGSGGASGSGGSTTSAPSTGDDEEETDDKKEEDKATGDGDTSSTTEATDTEDTEDSGTGSTTEDAESSEDTSEKPKTETEEKEEESKDDEKKDEEKKEDETKDEESKDEEKKEEETKDEESKDEESKDEESKDEDKKEEDKKDEESKDEGESKDKEESKDAEEDKSDSEDKKDEKKDEKSEDEDTEKTKESASEKKEETAEEDKEQTKESKSSSDDEEDADSRKAARIRLAKKKGRKAKKADVITPRKRSAKRPSRKGTTASTRPATKPKSSKLKKQTIVKQVRVKKLKPKTKPKSADLRGSSSIVKSNKRKVKANIIRAPSSIPAAFSRQRREKNLAFNDMFQRQGRHIRSRRSVTVLGENATFPAMMHSISIISPIEDLDEKELEAWEKMIEMEGKSEEVSVFESITKLPLMNGEGAYCFSVVSLMSASALLAAIVMIISLSVAMVCSHLHARSSAKAVDLY